MLIVLPVVRQRFGTVELVEEGVFFCLHCNADRGFQLRSWQQTRHLFYIEVGKVRGEFVRCNTCRSAFDLEALDESSTSSLESLRDFPPRFAMRDETPGPAAKSARRGTTISLAEYLDS